MNFKLISKNYPKAFRKLSNEYPSFELDKNRFVIKYTDGLHAVLMTDDFFIRNLYDFFDKQRIFVWVHKNGDLWFNNLNRVDSKSRPKAESAAFNRAFKILEGKL